MSNSSDRGPVVNVFLADSSPMGCELMAESLRRSRYQFAVIGSGTESDCLRSDVGNSMTSVDVAVISSNLKDGPLAGLSLARDIRIACPSVRIIILLDSMERSTVVEAFRSGAHGILSRDKSFDVLCRCIHAVYQGQVWADSKEMQFALDALGQTEAIHPVTAKSHKGPVVLTNREETVARLVSEGLTNRDISEQLKLSENTVRNYLFRIFNKVGTSNRLELAIYVLNRKTKDQQEEQLKSLQD
jgi:two-component system, NarL family, nitrate/nitrite response regulator NarL